MNTLREQLIQEAEASVKDARMHFPAADHNRIFASHARLLAFIKGQKLAAYVGSTAHGDIAYSQSEPVDDLTAVYTDPETLLP